MRRMTKLLWDRISCDMDKFYVRLHSITGIDMGKSLIRRTRIVCEEGLVAVPVTDCADSVDEGRLCELTTSD